MMVALLLYAYCMGVYSSRKIARETYEDVAFRALCGEAHPHFTTIKQFRLEHRAAFMALRDGAAAVLPELARAVVRAYAAAEVLIARDGDFPDQPLRRLLARERPWLVRRP